MPYELYVFGSNGEGQLGIEAADIVQTPTLANSWPQDKSIKSICGGDNHTLIVSSTGCVYHAGNTEKRQLGPVPSRQPRIERFQKSNKTNVWLCGAACESSAYIRNEAPEMPNGPNTTTILVEGASHWGEGGSTQHILPYPIVDFAAGNWHYVAILSNGDVYGWGKSRLDQLGPNLSAQQRITEPTLLQEDVSFRPVRVVCGKEFTYLVSDPSTGEHRLLGRDKFSLRSSMPAHIKGWKQIGATWHAILVLFHDGRLTAWGKDNMWKLLPEGLPAIEQMAVGSEHVLALTKDGRLISWGWGKHGNCGNLDHLGEKVKNDMVSAIWNEIVIPRKIKFLGAGFCTSFVLTEGDLS